MSSSPPAPRGSPATRRTNGQLQGQARGGALSSQAGGLWGAGLLQEGLSTTRGRCWGKLGRCRAGPGRHSAGKAQLGGQQRGNVCTVHCHKSTAESPAEKGGVLQDQYKVPLLSCCMISISGTRFAVVSNDCNGTGTTAGRIQLRIHLHTEPW